MRRHLLVLVIAGFFAGSSTASDSVSVSGGDGNARLDYVGDDWRVGLGLSDEGDVVAELLGVLAMGQRDAWLAEGWYQDGAGGLKLNYHWLPGDGDPAEQDELPGVYKVYLAADQNRWDDRKLSIGAGYEKQDLFFSTQLSFGLTDERLVDDFSRVFEDTLTGMDAMGRPFRQLQTTTVLTEIYEQAYDYGLGVRVGRFFNEPNVRVQAGLDYEWGDFDSDQVTLSGTAEKFFTGTGHSLALSLERYRKTGDFEQDDSDTRATLIWRYAFGQSYRPRLSLDAGMAESTAPVDAPAAAPVERTETRVVRSNVEMESDAFFGLDSADLRADSRDHLRSIAELITRGQIVGRISVVGHTCDLGPERYNQDLSNRRAEAVKRELVALGVDPAAIVTDGRGEAEPRVPNTSESNRELNRRVDVQFIRVVETEETVSVMVEPEPLADAVSVREEPVREVPAWVMRALRNPAQHKRTVDVYRFERTETTVELGEREFLNRAPLAENDAVSVARNGDELFIDVLANDEDPDGDALTVVSVTQPASGAVVVNSGDFLTYTPAEGFQGEDSFTYVVSDGTETATATVTVSVDNDAPVAQPDSALTSAGVAIVIDVLANDTDPNGDALTLVAVSSASGGTTSIVGNSVRYAPEAGFVGTDSFTYTVQDAGGAEVTAEVTVTVTEANDAPVAVPDSAATVEGTPVVIDVLANDSDPDGDALTLVAVTSASGGTTSLVGNSVRYEPEAGFIGTDSFTYTVRDARGAESTAEVTVTVTAEVPNAAPVAQDDLVITNTFSIVMIDVLANDSDPDGDPLVITELLDLPAPSVAVLTVTEDNQIRFQPVNWDGEAIVVRYRISDGRGGFAEATLEIKC